MSAADPDTSSHPSSSEPDSYGDLMARSLSSTHLSFPSHFSPLERILLAANGNLQRILSAYYNAPVTVQVIKCLRSPDSPCTPTPDRPVIYDRLVSLHCLNSVFCLASSSISISAPRIVALIESKSIGIGQLFRHFNALPEFQLLDCGLGSGAGRDLFEAPGVAPGTGTAAPINPTPVRNATTSNPSPIADNTNADNSDNSTMDGMWRLYNLTSRELGVECLISESFSSQVLCLKQS